MRIIYVAKHDSGGNDDEGAIHFALEKLGHEVVRIRESHSKGVNKLQGDFLLCHHWHDLATLASVKIPKVSWCFDLIEWDDSPRHKARVDWAKQLQGICDISFFSDGDWALKTGAHWLTQGADEREVTDCKFTGEKDVDILFVGGIGYGRDKFVRELRQRYGERFKHILKGCHGATLASEISRAKILVAPDSPVTDRYWSNRVYNVLRLGGFLIHPMSKGLQDQLNLHGWWYGDRESMFTMIDDWIPRDASRISLMAKTQQYILQYHTYRQRCEELVRIVKEELL